VSRFLSCSSAIRVIATVTLLGRFLKDSIADINIGAYTGSVEVAASKDIILGVVFGGGVLAEV
jgi:hypothetical protein